MRQAWQLAGRGLLAALAMAAVMSAAIASLIMNLPKVWGVACLRDALDLHQATCALPSSCRQRVWIN